MFRRGKRRIVLATNVAETSLTVPGIKYVIDAGLARIKRYSARSQDQPVADRADFAGLRQTTRGVAGAWQQALRFVCTAKKNWPRGRNSPRAEIQGIVARRRDIAVMSLARRHRLPVELPHRVRSRMVTASCSSWGSGCDEPQPLGRQLA